MTLWAKLVYYSLKINKLYDELDERDQFVIYILVWLPIILSISLELSSVWWWISAAWVGLITSNRVAYKIKQSRKNK